MKRTLLCLFVSICALSLLVGCKNKNNEELHGTSTRHAETWEPAQPPGYTSFGEPMRLSNSEVIPVGAILANPTAYQDRYVRVEGNINKVCQSKGCWMELTDATATQPLFVQFTCPIQGRLLPATSLGKPVVVEGYVKVKQISESEARHIKQEAGATPQEVAMIKGPQLQITLASPGAQVAGIE